MTKILVIEDDDLTRQAIYNILTFSGYEVEVAEDGPQGVDKAQEHTPDLIVCDIMMPTLDGFGVLRALQCDKETAQIPFIFLTARTDRTDMRQGMELGADDYLTKPFAASELRAAVEARLTKHAALLEPYESRIDRLKGAVVHTLPHEVMTPLNSILGYSELLVSDGEAMTKGEVIELVGHINKSSRRLLRVVENIVIYAQIEARRQELEQIALSRQFLTVVTQEWLQTILSLKARQFNRASDLIIKAPKSVTIPVFKDDFVKIAEELVDNGFKFSPGGTLVEVTIFCDEDNCVLSVKNFGRGMTPAQIEQVAEYSQFDRKIYEQQGLGLGLAISKGLINIYGGKLIIDSLPNQHTTAQAVLPLACP
jgi:DNA-binding response OmpR family regulator